MHFFDNNEGFAVGTGNNILFTADGGSSWGKLAGIGSGGNYYRNVFFLDKNIGFICGGNALTEGIMLKTTNGGLTWSELNVNSNGGAIYGLYFTDAQTGYYSNYVGEIRKTTNGGNTWKLLISGTTFPLIRLYFTNENTGYACGDGGTILKTVDAGATWELMTNFSDNYLHDIVFLDENIGYAVGGNVAENSSIIFKTTNAGENWSVDAISPKRLAGCDLLSLETGYACGFNGTIYKVTDIVASKNEPNENHPNFTIFPNQANNYLIFDCGTSPVKDKSLTILNSIGVEVYKQGINQQLSNIDLSSLGAGGIYYLLISGINGKASEIRSFIKL